MVRRGLCRSGEGLRQGAGRGDQVQNSELRPADRGVPHHVGGAVPQLHVSRRTVQPPREVAHRRPRPLPLRGGDDGVPYARLRESARRKVVVGARQPLLHVDEPAAAGHRGDARGRGHDSRRQQTRDPQGGARNFPRIGAQDRHDDGRAALRTLLLPAHGPCAAVPRL